jgi:Fe-S-cluster containining protein
MTNAEKLFLNRDQAIDAIARDFEQYPSQFNLWVSLMPLVFDGDAYLLEDPDGSKLWMKTPHHKKPFRIDRDRVGSWLVQQLQSAHPPIEHLASICSRIFQTPVKPAWDADDPSRSGVWIETKMTDFACIQCGHCCQTLDYQDGCSVADFRRWRQLGCDDILEWVGTTRTEGEVTACKIWMVPGTNRFAERCPWLKKQNGQHRYACTIYDLRPTICREYPGSRKHARMTGCRGV